jgi:hypothetical protein
LDPGRFLLLPAQRGGIGRARRIQVLASISQQSGYVLDAMRIDIQKELETERKRLIKYFLVCVACPALMSVLLAVGRQVPNLAITLFVALLLTFLVLTGFVVIQMIVVLTLRRKLKVLNVRK